MEHVWKIDKLIPALLMMILSWSAIALNLNNIDLWVAELGNNHLQHLNIGLWTVQLKKSLLDNTLLHHLGKTAEVLIFLMGAMAIVELIDYFSGFTVIQKLIKTKSKRVLLWILSFITFFLSAVIDNLTATIVMISVLRKLVDNQSDKMWFSGFIVIAANAGGAWSPIGDITTTMLWLANKVSAGALMKTLLIPSLLNLIVPLLIGSFLPVFKGEIVSRTTFEMGTRSKFAFFVGLGLIIFVPIFKILTNLPPYMGMMLSFALFALISEFMSDRNISFTGLSGAESPTITALGKIEIPSVLFFLGILMTVASIESLGMISQFGKEINALIPPFGFTSLLGIASAVIDNVPLVAASIGMFQEVLDSHVWHWLAYTSGCGGSLLIIGSAAGIVAMGMEKISFVWYFKKISLLAMLGYVAGILFLYLTT